MKRPTVIILKAAATLLVVLVLYVISYGPVYGYVQYSFSRRLDDTAANRFGPVETVYAPILWISKRNQTVKRLGYKYVVFFSDGVLPLMDERPDLPDPPNSP